MNRTRAERMRWCKERAVRELEYGGPSNAIASLASDFGKHPETEALTTMALLGLAHTHSDTAMRRFIEGFAE
jgi:hypothetical protein